MSSDGREQKRPQENQQNTPAIQRHPATNGRLAVRVDGEWLPFSAEYGPVLVFWWSDDWDHLDNATQIDVRADGVSYVAEDRRPHELDEYLDEGGVTSYIAPNDMEISNVEVHDVDVSEAHERFPNGGGA